MIKPSGFKLTRIVPLVALLSLTGCLGAEMHQAIKDDVPMVEAGAKKAEQPEVGLNYDPLVVTDRVWTGNRAMRMRHGLPLPAAYEGQHSITLVSAKSMGLPEIASYISQQTNVPVRLVDGAEKVVGGPVGASAMNAAAAAGGAAGAAGAVIPTGTADAASGANDTGMKLAYQGPLSGFLDNVSSYFGVSWRYDGAAVIVSRFETRTFTLESMSGTSTYSDGISDAGGGSSGAAQATGSISQSNKMDGKVDYWGEIEGSVNTILSGVGTAKANPSSGTITIITTPEIMRTVAQFIGQENERATRQVAVTVELFTLSLDNSESYETNVNLVYSKLGGAGQKLANFGLNGVTALAPGDAGNVFGASIVSPNSRWNGSRALIQALSSIGNVSRVARIPLTTLNNRPATRRIGRDIAYLAQRSTSTTSGTDTASETLTPGTVQEGFSLQVTPRMMADGRMLIQFSLSVTDLLNLAQFPATGTPEIQLPETSSRVFVQQALLNDGDTLVLAGFDQDQKSAKNSGFLNPFNILLGGNASSENSRDMLFLTVTPREIDVPHRQLIDMVDGGQQAGSR